MLILSKSLLSSNGELVKCLMNGKYYIFNQAKGDIEVDIPYDYIYYIEDNILFVEQDLRFFNIDAQGKVLADEFPTELDLLLLKKADPCPDCKNNCQCSGFGFIPLGGDWTGLLD